MELALILYILGIYVHINIGFKLCAEDNFHPVSHYIAAAIWPFSATFFLIRDVFK